MENIISEVTPAVGSNTDNNINNLAARPAAKQLLNNVTNAVGQVAAEGEALWADIEALGEGALALGAQLARPTPGMLKLVHRWYKLQRDMLREVRGHVGSLSAVLPVATAALKAARDRAGAYSVEELQE